ncbi:hypothetical protein BK635_16305 [Pseudomonas chlororaphis]|nr:hypothetical protein BK635_16305 [Pseudomonas chlororaphis]
MQGFIAGVSLSLLQAFAKETLGLVLAGMKIGQQLQDFLLSFNRLTCVAATVVDGPQGFVAPAGFLASQMIDPLLDGSQFVATQQVVEAFIGPLEVDLLLLTTDLALPALGDQQMHFRYFYRDIFCVVGREFGILERQFLLPCPTGDKTMQVVVLVVVERQQATPSQVLPGILDTEAVLQIVGMILWNRIAVERQHLEQSVFGIAEYFIVNDAEQFLVQALDDFMAKVLIDRQGRALLFCRDSGEQLDCQGMGGAALSSTQPLVEGSQVIAGIRPLSSLLLRCPGCQKGSQACPVEPGYLL